MYELRNEVVYSLYKLLYIVFRQPSNVPLFINASSVNSCLQLIGQGVKQHHPEVFLTSLQSLSAIIRSVLYTRNSPMLISCIFKAPSLSAQRFIFVRLLLLVHRITAPYEQNYTSFKLVREPFSRVYAHNCMGYCESKIFLGYCKSNVQALRT